MGLVYGASCRGVMSVCVACSVRPRRRAREAEANPVAAGGPNVCLHVGNMV